MGKVREPKWKTTAIPTEIYQRIQKEAKKAGYTGVTDFVKDSCRRRLEQLERPQAIPA